MSARHAVVAVLVVIGGCATPQTLDQATLQAANQRLICVDVNQCRVWWQRAQVWVAQNSGYRIQTATDAVISTYGPFGGKTELAYQVTKLPESDGSAEIVVRAGCDNVFGCYPNATVGIAGFKNYVRNGR